MKNTYFETIEELTTFAEKSTYRTLSHLYALTGNDTILNIMQSTADNRKALQFTDIAAESLTLQAEHKQTINQLVYARTQAERIHITDNERESWNKKADELKTLSDKESDRIAMLERNTDYQLSRFQDIVNEWVIAYLTAEPTDKDIIKAELMTDDENEQNHIACVRVAKRAINRYINNQSGVNGLDGITTIKKDATADAMQAWFASGKVTDTRYPIGRTESTEELTYNAKADKWQFVTRYKTAKQGYSLEQLSETGDIDGYIRTQNSYTDTIGALEQIQDLLTTANLTDKQQSFLQSFCSVNARKAGLKARSAYYTAHIDNATKYRNKKQFADGLSKAEYTARLEHAFNYIGIYAANRKSEFMSKLKTALQPYYNNL